MLSCAPCLLPQRYYGTAVGKARQAAKNEIEKLKLTEMTCKQAVMEAARILHKVSGMTGLHMSWPACLSVQRGTEGGIFMAWPVHSRPC